MAAAKEGEEERNSEQSFLSVEDAAWLSSLSEPELDFLISLKELAMIRAKNAGHKDISDKFDIRMLRSLGTILLDHFKERAQNVPTSINSDLIDKLPLLSSHLTLSINNNNLEIEIPNFVTPNRKRMYQGLSEEGAQSSKKQKTRERKNKVASKSSLLF
ncbi:hypothetical protein LUZ60_006990 [Juncus effusus]|nr:hypothetical protein LUZ60_006990 [Juncus effusus]